MEYRVIEIKFDTKTPIVVRVLIFLFGKVLSKIRSRPLYFQIESALNEMSKQGYGLVSQIVNTDKKGQSKSVLLIFSGAGVKENLYDKVIGNSHEINWNNIKTRKI